MRKIVLFLFVLFNICMLNAGLLLNNHVAGSERADAIELLGNLPGLGTIRSPLQPIVVTQYSDYLDVVFNANLGIIAVQIFDATNGIVYQDAIDTSVKPWFEIDTQDFAPGNYSIWFTNSQGQYLCGEFVIE